MRVLMLMKRLNLNFFGATQRASPSINIKPLHNNQHSPPSPGAPAPPPALPGGGSGSLKSASSMWANTHSVAASAPALWVASAVVVVGKRLMFLFAGVGVGIGVGRILGGERKTNAAGGTPLPVVSSPARLLSTL